MVFLISTGGLLYVPCMQCEYGIYHYSYMENDPPTVKVKPSSYLKRCLRRLVAGVQDLLPSRSTNLAYGEGSDEIEIGVDFLRNKYPVDLFVGPYDAILNVQDKQFARFRYAHRRFFHDRQLIRNQRVRNVFGDIDGLGLYFIGSAGINQKLLERQDLEAVLAWGEDCDRSNVNDLLRRLEGHLINPAAAGEDLFTLRVLHALCQYDDPDEEMGVDVDAVVDGLMDDNYECRCEGFDEFDDLTEKAAHGLEVLKDRGLVTCDSRGLYSIAEDYRKPEFQPPDPRQTTLFPE